MLRISRVIKGSSNLLSAAAPCCQAVVYLQADLVSGSRKVVCLVGSSAQSRWKPASSLLGRPAGARISLAVALLQYCGQRRANKACSAPKTR